MPNVPFSRRPAAALALGCLLGLLFGAVACDGKKKKKKDGDKNKTVVINWKEKWDPVYGDGQEGKFWCDQGFGDVNKAATPEEKEAGFDKVVKGYKMLKDAIERGEALLETVKAKEPGRYFPEWEENLAGWSEIRSKVRKNIPLEYIDRLKE